MRNDRRRLKTSTKQNASSVGVIGGGMAGLTAAFQLHEQGIPVRVYESDVRVGGVVRTVRQGGFSAECGPNFIADRSPHVGAVVARLGLQDRRVDVPPTVSGYHVFQNGKLIRTTGSLWKCFRTDFASSIALMRLLFEPFLPGQRQDAREESLADFLTRRLGKGFGATGMYPPRLGLEGSEPHRLSLRHSFRNLYDAEQTGRSVRRGWSSDQWGTEVGAAGRCFSFDSGLSLLPDRMHERLGDAIVTGARVTQVEERNADWQLTFRQCDHVFEAVHRAVIVAAPAHRLPEIELKTYRYTNWRVLAGIRYSPMASVVFGFPDGALDAQWISSLGVMIPDCELLPTLSIVFAWFPNRAPAGHFTITSYLGGCRCPDLASQSEEDLAQIALGDLRTVLGLREVPVFQHVSKVPGAIPRYDLGYAMHLTRVRELEGKSPGLFMAGSYLGGASVAESMISAQAVAERAAAYLRMPCLERC